MKILLIGRGHVGEAAHAALSAQHEVAVASRSGTPSVDITDPASITVLFDGVGVVDAVVVCVGSAPFKPFAELTRRDYETGIAGKVLSQVDVVRLGLDHVTDGGSFTLTTGILARQPIATGVASSLANGAVEAFVMAAAVELPRGVRINAVSPTVLASAPGYFDFFPGFPPVDPDLVGQAYLRSVMGVQTGQVFPV